MDVQVCFSLRRPFAKVNGQNRLESKESNFVNYLLKYSSRILAFN